jgi:hypothetical protein
MTTVAIADLSGTRSLVSAQKQSRGGGAPGRTAASRQAILLEAIQEQNRATIEAVFASKQELEQRMDEMRRELTLRLEVVQAIVKKNSEDILQNTEGIRKNSEDIRNNSEDIRKNSEDIRKNSEQIRLNTEELGRHSEELRRIAAMLERKSDQASLIRAREESRRFGETRRPVIEARLAIGSQGATSRVSPRGRRERVVLAAGRR